MQPVIVRGASGGGGGGDSHTPVEAPDSLQSVATAKVLLLMGLGQTEGPERGLQSIYLDGVPLQAADGSMNFERVTAEWRTGTQSQTRIPGFSDIETEYSLGIELKQATPLVRQIDDLDADAVRVTVSVSSLRAVNDQGDTNPTSVEMAVDIKPAIGSYVEVGRILISGKARSKYQRARRFALTGSGPWQVRLRRLTADSTSQNLQNATAWDSFTVINEAPMRYPNYALLAVKFDARQFSSFPKIEGRWRWQLLQVPSNYDPVTRKYAGSWDGTFVQAWSDNPCWWLYTYMTDPRFNIGLPDGAHKWDLYTIAQWCDELVSDGRGGLRPRFTCNMVQAESADPWQVVQDSASVFCGRVIPFAGGIRVVADMPGKAARKQFVPANVIDGVFTYGDSELKDRHTSATVKFVDPEDGDKTSVESVEHAEGMLLYGHNPVEVAAVGCTSRAQAQQLGRYILETAVGETETVSFGSGAYGMDLMPGEVFEISDPSVVGARYGGRLLSVDGVAVQLDAAVELQAGVTYSLEVPLPDGTLQRRGIATGAGVVSQITLVAPFSQVPIEGTTWLLVATNVQPTLWRCISNTEQSGDPLHRQIFATQHDPNKWLRIEANLKVAESPVSLLDQLQQLVRDVQIVETLREVNKSVINVAEISWQAGPLATTFDVAWRVAGGNWEHVQVKQAYVELPQPGVGLLEVRITARDMFGRASLALAQRELLGLTEPPASLADLRLDALNGFALLDWPQSPDIDVRVGGSIRIRHSPLLSGAEWDNATDIGPAIPGSATQATLPLLAGTYLAKAVDSGGRESPAAVAVVTTAPGVLSLNAVDELPQHPAFAGACGAGLALIGGVLTLAGAMTMDGWASVDSIPDWDTAGGISPAGVYEFDRIVDLGAVNTCRVSGVVRSRCYLAADVVDNWLNIDSRPDWDGAVAGRGGAVIEISTTPDDPLLGNWSAWQPLRIADYAARAFRFRAVLTSDSPDVAVDVLELSASVDVPDRVEQFANLAVPAVGLQVNFSPPFRALPAIGLSAQGLQPGEYYEIIARDNAGFFVTIKNASGVGVSGRTVDVTARGYGYAAA